MIFQINQFLFFFTQDSYTRSLVIQWLQNLERNFWSYAINKVFECLFCWSKNSLVYFKHFLFKDVELSKGEKYIKSNLEKEMWVCLCIEISGFFFNWINIYDSCLENYWGRLARRRSKAPDQKEAASRNRACMASLKTRTSISNSPISNTIGSILPSQIVWTETAWKAYTNGCLTTSKTNLLNWTVEIDLLIIFMCLFFD